MHSIVMGALRRSRRVKWTAKSARRVRSYRAMYRQYQRAHTLPFFALAASRPPADQGQPRAENARLRTSLTTVWTSSSSSKIRSRRRSKRPDRGARIALWRSPIRVVAHVFPLSGCRLWYSRGTRVPLLGLLEYCQYCQPDLTRLT